MNFNNFSLDFIHFLSNSCILRTCFLSVYNVYKVLTIKRENLSPFSVSTLWLPPLFDLIFIAMATKLFKIGYALSSISHRILGQCRKKRENKLAQIYTIHTFSYFFMIFHNHVSTQTDLFVEHCDTNKRVVSLPAKLYSGHVAIHTSVKKSGKRQIRAEIGWMLQYQ